MSLRRFRRALRTPALRVWPRARANCDTHRVTATLTPTLSSSTVGVAEPETTSVTDLDTPWVVLVWNDPVNLMTYVSFVLQKLFGYPKAKADRLMMQVHEEGKAVVSQGARESAEMDVLRLHENGLWATMQQDK